jgi:hypothetical protein
MLAALLAVSVAAAPPRAPPVPVRVLGNKVLSDYIYRRAAKIPRGAEVDAQLVAAVERRVLTYLRGQGYELARVAVRPRSGGVEIAVDEGRLDKIVFPGQDAMRALGMKFTLKLPNDVFNRAAVDRQLPNLEQQFGVKIRGYEVRERKVDPNRDLAISSITGLDQLIALPEPSRYELYVFADREELPRGLDFKVQARDPDGLTAWLFYRFHSVLLDDDRFEVFPEVGLRLQDIVQDGQGRRFISRAGASFRWLSPPLTSQKLRPYVQPRFLFLSRQRRDLDISRYDFIELEPTFGLQVPFTRRVDVGLGVGMQFRRLTGLRDGPDPPPRVDPVQRARALVEANVGVVAGLRNLRLDRRHRFSLSARYLSALAGDGLFHGRFKYEKSFGLGLDEVRVRFDSETLFGTAAFTDEVRVADHLRGVYGDEFYTQRIASLRTEYILSVVREYLKLGVYHDGAVFEGADRDTGRTFTRFANSFGPGAHTVLFDLFRVSVYASVGFMSADGPTDAGAVLEITQLF